MCENMEYITCVENTWNIPYVMTHVRKESIREEKEKSICIENRKRMIRIILLELKQTKK